MSSAGQNIHDPRRAGSKPPAAARIAVQALPLRGVRRRYCHVDALGPWHRPVRLWGPVHDQGRVHDGERERGAHWPGPPRRSDPPTGSVQQGEPRVPVLVACDTGETNQGKHAGLVSRVMVVVEPEVSGIFINTESFVSSVEFSSGTNTDDY